MIETISRALLAAAGTVQKRLSVVLFHRVLSAPDAVLVDEPDVEQFRLRVRWLKSAFRLMSLREAAERLLARDLPPRAAVITFDDGYADNASNAMPVLLEEGVPATFFCTTRYVDGGMMWNDRVVEAVRAWEGDVLDAGETGFGRFELDGRRHEVALSLLMALKYRPYDERDALATRLLELAGARPAAPMMNEAQIASLHDNGMEVGGHTVSHPILTALDPEEARAEIAANKASLERIIGSMLSTFAYPNGQPGRDFDGAHVEMVREAGYIAAVTTAPGTASYGTSPFEIPRFSPWDATRSRYIARMTANYFRSAPPLDR